MKSLLIASCWGLLAAGSVEAAELQLQVIDKEPPSELAAGIRATLQNKAVQVMDGDQPLYAFWFCKEVPLKSKPSSPTAALDAIRETTLVGAAQVFRKQRDYRDNEITAGLYTLRYGFQPQDGDHLGTAPFPYFLVLIPAKSDESPDALKTYRAMTKASSRNTATGHPSVLSVRPPVTNNGAIPRLTEPEAEHKAVLLQLSGRAPDATAPEPVLMELVVAGHTSHL